MLVLSPVSGDSVEPPSELEGEDVEPSVSVELVVLEGVDPSVSVGGLVEPLSEFEGVDEVPSVGVVVDPSSLGVVVLSVLGFEFPVLVGVWLSL